QTCALPIFKDLDFEAAALFAWILVGLWWFRHYFDAESDPTRLRWGLFVLAIGLLTAVVYALAGTALLENQLRPEVGLTRTAETLLAALAGSPTAYRALTERASWFLSTLPIVSYALILVALTRELVAYCERQDWIPAFYQVEEPAPYRALGLTLVPIGAEAVLQPSNFGLQGKKRADLRYAIHRSERSDVRFVFGRGPEVVAEHSHQLQGLSERWLQSHRSPELGYS